MIKKARRTDIQTMAYDENYRTRAVAFKESDHTFRELKKEFGVSSFAYYEWKGNKEKTGWYAPKKERGTRRRKIGLEALKSALAEKPGARLRELAGLFHCSEVAVCKRLKQLNITSEQRHEAARKSRENSGGAAGMAGLRTAPRG
jgi:transposase